MRKLYYFLICYSIDLRTVRRGLKTRRRRVIEAANEAMIPTAARDYLLNGTANDKSADAITDEELLIQFRKVEQLPTNKKKLVKEFLDAFIFKNDLQKQLST